MKMPVLTVFIASSQEGLEIAVELQHALIRRLGLDVKPVLWSRAFDLSATFVESLERACEQADFAVLVLTPDDVTISRGNRLDAPRDNLLFELGLFMGRLSRERCFMLIDGGAELKVPTDLLGVHAATCTRSSLDASCLRIADQMMSLGTRYKQSSQQRLAAYASRVFRDSIVGAWWERHSVRGGQPNVRRVKLGVSVSFFRIEPDSADEHICFTNGKSFSKDGSLLATWRSTASRIMKDQCSVSYDWHGYMVRGEASTEGFRGSERFNSRLTVNGLRAP